MLVIKIVDGAVPAGSKSHSLFSSVVAIAF